MLPEAENFFEGKAKVLIGGGVDDRIEETIGVAQPKKEGGKPTWNLVG